MNSGFILKQGMNALRQNNSLNMLKFPFSTENETKKVNSPLINAAVAQHQMTKPFDVNKQSVPNFDFLKAKSIDFSPGWKSANVAVCSKAENNFYLDNETGNFKS